MIAEWKRNSFLGIHTQPAKVPEGGGDQFFADLLNMRIDGNGWLQLRPPVEDIRTFSNDITGVATTDTHAFLLFDNGDLKVAPIELLISGTLTNTNTPLTDSDLEGRLSLVDFGTYVVITSEGDDQGYIIDMREDKDFQVYPLGFDPPSEVTSEPILGNNKLEFGKIYVFRLSLIHAVGRTGTHIVRGDETGAVKRGNIIAGMESNLGEPHIYYVGDNLLQDIVFIDDDDNEYDIIETGDQDHDGIRFSDLEHNESATGMVLYQSETISVTQAGRYNINALEYRRVDYVGRLVDEVNQILRTTDFSTEDQWKNGFEANLNNDRLPLEAKSITKYNDLIYAPLGDKLVYSDLRFGDPIPWAFPKVNDVRPPTRVDFVEEINEVLIYGGRDGLYRHTGETEYNFREGQISGIGPLDGHAWGKTADALAFVGENGFYVTDATTVQPVSQSTLDELFEDHKTIAGNVLFLKNNEILFSIKQTDTDRVETTSQYKIEDGNWIRYNLPFLQVADIVEGDETLALIADGTDRLKRLDWNKTTATEIDWLIETQVLDFGIDRTKRFVCLYFTGNATGDLTFTAYPEGKDSSTKTFTARPDDPKAVKVPINRLARRLHWKLEGTGEAKIQGLRMEAEV